MALINLVVIITIINISNSLDEFKSGGLSDSDVSSVNYEDKDYVEYVEEDSGSKEKNIDIERSGTFINNTIYKGTIKGIIKLRGKDDVNYLRNLSDVKDISEENELTKNKEIIEKDLQNALREILNEHPQFREKNHFRSGLNDAQDDSSSSASNETDVSIRSFPYTACIHKKGSHVTNGALLDKQWVLTAATDFYNVRESIKIYNVRLASTNCKNGKSIPIILSEIHPSYRVGSPDFDLALLKLAYPVEFIEKVQPIKITRKKGLSFLTVIYWAKIYPEKPSKLFPSPLNAGKGFLKYCKVDVLSQDKCKSYLRKSNMKLIDSTRCMKPDKDNCILMDSAKSSLVVTSDGLFGITSPWINKNVTDGNPVVYSVLSQPLVKNWIYHVMMSK